jgi:hypothetical protein
MQKRQKEKGQAGNRQKALFRRWLQQGPNGLRHVLDALCAVEKDGRYWWPKPSKLRAKAGGKAGLY